MHQFLVGKRKAMAKKRIDKILNANSIEANLSEPRHDLGHGFSDLASEKASILSPQSKRNKKVTIVESDTRIEEESLPTERRLNESEKNDTEFDQYYN